MESKVTISESRFDELKLAEKELKETKYQLDCERQKLETATGLLKSRDEDNDRVINENKSLRLEVNDTKATCDELRKKLKETIDERDNFVKRVEVGCKICPTAKERDELRTAICDDNPRIASLTKENDELKEKLSQMTGFRDACERQYQIKCDELGQTIAECNELKSRLASFGMPKPRLQRKVSELSKENEELKKRLNGDCKECVSLDEAKYLGKRLGAADKVISDVLYKVKAHNENFGGPTSDETFKYIEKCITEYQTTTTAESDGVGTLFIEAVDCIRAAFDAWTQEDGTDKSYNKIGEILRKYIESMKKRGGNANG